MIITTHLKEKKQKGFEYLMQSKKISFLILGPRTSDPYVKVNST